MEKQAQNVAKMRLLGAKVIPVLDGGLCAAVHITFFLPIFLANKHSPITWLIL